MSVRKRDLIGRIITDVDLQGHWNNTVSGTRVWMTDPVFTLDNGRRLYFNVHEHPDGGEYGIEASLTSKRHQPQEEKTDNE